MDATTQCSSSLQGHGTMQGTDGASGKCSWTQHAAVTPCMAHLHRNMPQIKSIAACTPERMTHLHPCPWLAGCSGPRLAVEAGVDAHPQLPVHSNQPGSGLWHADAQWTWLHWRSGEHADSCKGSPSHCRTLNAHAHRVKLGDSDRLPSTLLDNAAAQRLLPQPDLHQNAYRSPFPLSLS